MRWLATTATFALIATVAHGECVVVAPEVRPSRQNALATVIVDGKAAKHLQLLLHIQLFPDGTESETDLTSNARGNINLKDLHVGRNCLTAYSAVGDTKLTGSICLDVTVSPNSAPTKFPLVLMTAPLEPSMEKILMEKEKLPIELSVPTLMGTVADLTGAVIPNAEISIYGRDPNAKRKPIKITTDNEGAFAALLSEGIYTIVVTMPGFATRFMELEIKNGAAKRNIEIELKIGDSC